MYFWLIAIIVFTVDRLTKISVQRYMEPGQSIPLVRPIFHLTYVHNYGAAFGMLAHKTTFFIVVTVVVLSVVAFFYRRIPKEKKLLLIALALQFGGAIGNLTDRLIYGYVIDFLDFRVWPVFNIADSAIVIGVGLLFWEFWRSDKQDQPGIASGGE
ncbi:lipoprotein signal peptidase [Thermincola ferriacetica]|uniref:Lipoprotein signal peptidase n=1 Tax=Thermincola ferriacetica TaxID=281456 RepID=A0A0L6W3I8_9FIRM|nr:signal peptidase II [Thermincola ferriacetica]KNZ70152.1 lipoprotein signal peptidase [Thermincola ferriacetica]